MAPESTQTGFWTQLPIEIVDNIIKRLDLPADVISFSGVCKPWRYVALGMHMNLCCKLPIYHFVPKGRSVPMLLHLGCEGPHTHQLYSLNEQKIYGGFCLEELSNKWIVGSGAGWVVTVDTTDSGINLLNPLTRHKIPLPHLSTLPWCDLRADYDDPTAYWYIRKVIVCSYQGSFLIVALVSQSKTIRFCRIGDSKWTRLEMSPLWVQDIIVYNSKLYAINDAGALFEINIDNPAKVTMVAILLTRPVGIKCFLVHVCGELVLLSRSFGLVRKGNRNVTMTRRFQVYKLVEDDYGYFEQYKCEVGMQYPEKATHSWVPLENLGHHMVFIGYNYSLSFDSRVYPTCKGNRIYFADYGHDEHDYSRMRGIHRYWYHDVGVYLMEKQRVEYFDEFCNASSSMNMVWFSPYFLE